jgi:hypothetical protein
MKKTFLIVTLMAASVHVLIPVAGAEPVAGNEVFGGGVGGGLVYAIALGSWAVFGLMLLRPER